MAAEATREDAGRLDGRRLAKIGEGEGRPDGEAPGPAAATWNVLGLGDDVGEREHDLPAGGVEDRAVAELNRRPSRRGVSPQLGGDHVRREPPLAAPTDEQPRPSIRRQISHVPIVRPRAQRSPGAPQVP